MSIPPELVCAHCEKAFIRPPRGRIPTYCGAKCRNTAGHLRARSDGRYAARLALQPPKNKAKVELLCPYCFALFFTAREKSPHCGSDPCRKRHRSDYMRPVVNRRRAAKRLPGAESIDPMEIFIRDGWTCWLCRQSIDPNAASKSPLSASLDHVIPLSKGGTHTRGNVRSAHLRCNLSKGAKIVP